MATASQILSARRGHEATHAGSLAQRVTNQIRAALEQGVRPWVRPWNSEHAGDAFALPLRANGTPYRGINVLILWSAALEQGYAARSWYTFKQAQALGGAVRRGERGRPVVFYSGNRTQAEGSNDEASDAAPARAVLRSYVVFNAEQLDGLPSAAAHEIVSLELAGGVDLAERFARVPAHVEHAGSHAFYVPSQDFIRMPPQSAFPDQRRYYATLAHELAHWTRHPTRLDRDFGSNRFGDAGYAREELVAELTSAFIGAELGLPVDHINDHASYIDAWLKVLDREPGALLAAAGKAQAAADFLRPWLMPIDAKA